MSIFLYGALTCAADDDLACGAVYIALRLKTQARSRDFNRRVMSGEFHASKTHVCLNENEFYDAHTQTQTHTQTQEKKHAHVRLLRTAGA